MSSKADSSSSDVPYYRPCVGAVLFNDAGLVWLGKRVTEPDSHFEYEWQMPQGGIDVGEDPEVAVFRELLEETGTNNAKIIEESKSWLKYDLPEHLLNRRRQSQFRGQTQKWFALRFTGSDHEFNLNLHATPEFSEWRWGRLQDVPELIVPFKRDVYNHIADEFRDIPKRITNE